MSPRTLVLGVIGADCHSVGNRILEATFAEAGFRVVNLGVMVSQEEFIDAAIESDAGAILVSSLYGHGEIDCEGFKAKCLERGLDDVVLWVGGNLVVGKTPPEAVERKFRGLGFDRVFGPRADLEAAVADLKAELDRRAGRAEPAPARRSAKETVRA